MTAPMKNLRRADADASDTLSAVVEGRGNSALAAGRKFALSAFNYTVEQVETLMPDYARILKFNPYHDARGRFTSKGGIGMAGVHSVSLGGVFNPANNRDRVAYSKWEKEQAANKPEFEEMIEAPWDAPYDQKMVLQEKQDAQDKAWLDKTDAAWHAIPQQDRRHVYSYTESSDFVNRGLSGKNGKEFAQNNMDVLGIDRAMAVSGGAPANMNVYRALSVSSLGIDKKEWQGLSSDQQVALLGGKLTGSTYKEKGYGSTSTLRSNAENFLKDTRVMAKIEVREGQKALYLGGGKNKDFELNRSNYSNEKEVLLSRNGGYRVKSVERHPTQGYAMMTVEYLGDMGD